MSETSTPIEAGQRTVTGKEPTWKTAMSTVPVSPLTPVELRVVDYLLQGMTPREIAAELKRSISTAHRHLRALRFKVNCPTRCPLPALVHRLLTAHQATAPTTEPPVPYLPEGEVEVLRALAEETRPFGLVTVSGLSPAETASALDTLIGKTGAANATHLVVLAHSWKLLPAEQDHATRSGASL
ncbi:helix-turn-helix transcriptional regulator [Streptomyces sp. F-1]|uniref:helix-turn-helix transcriptional regulator n=1 Tax=Streptomyces sp. F-1 TaxID=463642 RepID=UPI00086B2D77|nr:LuxR C-terminal-related transcriptional regulator [Streptomyces sp. F-1]SFY48732.1 hypothetical protein STEPF1_01958 [Streptomyces sp. F-1]